MQYSWLEPTDGTKRYEERSEGQRPSGARLIAMLDLDDPALPSIAVLLAEMEHAGVEIDEAAVKLGIQMGRHRWATRANQSDEKTSVVVEACTGSIVYYVRRGSVLKIGTTKSPKQRFLNLMPDEILAYEPGSFQVERARHRQFSHLRIGGTEHFRIAADLVNWTAEVRGSYGEPDASWPSMATLAERGRGTLTPPPPPTSPRLVTASQGADECGIRRNTVQVWGHRGVLKPAGRDARGRVVYFLDDVVHFASCSSAASIRPQ
jgi:hypothetical protein